ncbi:MAG TPA: 5-deoxy-glucuronate isomerase [Candidatus Methylomirabilis sp.]|nr:5-deoxy-glucuronate isomerase [Candidatus Methylomirabilis sp.]
MENAWLFRGTHRVQGRKRVIHQHNCGLEFLRYGRIVLGSGGGAVDLESQDEELGFVCLSGTGAIRVDGQTVSLGKYDALYLPRDSRCTVSSAGAFDLAEIGAPSSKKYPVQFVRFEDVLKNPKLVRKAGFEPYARTLHTLIGEDNVQAARLLAGVTFSKDGNWTSWPPHDHHKEKEEIYLYIDMPEPNFSLHLNYTDGKDMEMVVPVWEGDAVAIKKGYHYNVATPGTATGFLWMMAAVREEKDRVFTQVTVQPEFDGRFKLF